MKKVISVLIFLSLLFALIPLSVSGSSTDDKLSAKLIADDYFGPYSRMTENDISYIHLGEYGLDTEVFFITYASDTLYTTVEIRETYGGVEFFFTSGNVIHVYHNGIFYETLGQAYEAGLLTPDDMQEIHDAFFGVEGKRLEGDSNRDGKVTALDMLETVRGVHAFADGYGYRYDRDINKDKAIDLKDTLKLRLILKGVQA